MKCVSLFNGMSCGKLAFMSSGIEISEYISFEIDKYANRVAKHNFPNDKYNGSVFSADFTQYAGVDWLIGGSPCTYWSIAQKKNRETSASGLGWGLFMEYIRALKEIKPKFFIFENNKSMSHDVRESIDREFGFEAVQINSALVSAQNRQRLYWVGRQNEDKTYSKISIPLPQDKKILLKDVLDIGETAHCNGAIISDILKKDRHIMVAESVNVNPSGKGINGVAITIYRKSNCLTTNKGEGSKIIEPIRLAHFNSGNQGNRIYSPEGKSVCLSAIGGGKGAKTGLYFCPTTQKHEKIYTVRNSMIIINERTYPIKLLDGHYIIRKLTISECKKLQTVPEWFDMSVISNAQAYKCLGNGWTVEVISHIMKHCLYSL